MKPRCSEQPHDLDEESIPRTKEWSQLLIDNFGHNTLWSEYGIISYVTVSIHMKS